MLTRNFASMAAAAGKSVKQRFEHLVILDFEATCDEKKQPHPQEIIEFPAIILRTSDCQVLNEFHQYVRPKYHPQLSTFCTELTGIIQDTVDSSATFEDVMKDFDIWLKAQSMSSFTFVTCGDWDLGKMLPSQCQFYKLPIPPYFQQWINLKQIFASHSGTWPRGMPHMLTLLNLSLTGRHHSGIDDCRNIVAITKALLRQGADFQQTSSISGS